MPRPRLPVGVLVMSDNPECTVPTETVPVRTQQHEGGVLAGLPDNVLRPVCREIAQELAQVFLGHAKRVVQDMHEEHKQLLAKQNMVLQQVILKAQLSSLKQPVNDFDAAEASPASTPREYTKVILDNQATETEEVMVELAREIRQEMTSLEQEMALMQIPEEDSSMQAIRSKTPPADITDAENPALTGANGIEKIEDPDERSTLSGQGNNQASERFGSFAGRDAGMFEQQKKERASHIVQNHQLFEAQNLGIDKTDLSAEEYNVCNFYHETGIAQRIARAPNFGNFTLAVIAGNTLYIGVDADHNDKANLNDADIGFQISEHLFCIFFTFEWLVRFGAFRRKIDSLKDMWFKFDTVLVVLMIIETWIIPFALSSAGGIGPTGMIKMLRLLRLARMARLMRGFPELVAMIKGVKVASRAVGSALLMLVFLLYIFAIIMHMLLKEEQEEYLHERFDRLAIVMWTLLIDGTFLDNIGILSRALIATDHYIALLVLVVFVLGSALTVMNMLIGVLCEVVSAVAASEKEDNAIRLVKDNLLQMLKLLDEDGSGLISRQEIQNVIEDDGCLDVLGSLNVDCKHFMDQLDMFFEEKEELSIHQIMDLILMLRGDRPPTMKDMLHGQTFNRWKLSKEMQKLQYRMDTWATQLDHRATNQDRRSSAEFGTRAAPRAAVA
eukprot:gnl/TRDRNA2_/TRDRNA2_91353_c0_seq2.p1 gnl/TRDRNA2_/TRDRNA2_91353_c0~~gnl/TRDRNA2_/TRDRNA2_91353_c0_seq2.p1  ORF type:complete len:671 (+),score=144.58 gnl/TRDRNA2_/TRDRNA2_91353_c0_seq2:108-2120(+)